MRLCGRVTVCDFAGQIDGKLVHMDVRAATRLLEKLDIFYEGCGSDIVIPRSCSNSGNLSTVLVDGPRDIRSL
jgi:hypothetical protein